MSLAIWISVVSLLFTFVFNLFGLYFNTKNSKRTDEKDLTERIKDTARITVTLDMINSNTQEIKTEIGSMRKDINQHSEKLVQVEESVKSAHKRIDGLEKRFNEKEEQHKN